MRRVPVGGELEFSISVENVSDKPVTVLNPTFSRLARIETVDLLLIDANDKPVGELYRVGRQFAGSAQQNARWFWKALQPGEAIAKKDSVRVRVLKGGEQQLKPGKYSLQMVFFDKFLSEYPYEGLPPRGVAGNEPYREAQAKWNEKYSGKEIFRSNPVEIEVTR